MGGIAMPGEENQVGESDPEDLDQTLEDCRVRTQMPGEFVIPGESKLGSLLNVSRSVVRCAERSFVAGKYMEHHPHAMKSVNRLSDFLFVVARNADGKYSLSKG